MAALVNNGKPRTFTVHWAELAKCLPTEDDALCVRRRRELFETFDPQGGGILSQSRVIRAYFRMLPPVSGIPDTRFVLQQAWAVTRDIIQPICPIGIDRMDRNQFRALIIYIWSYFKLWDLFVQLGDTGTENRKVTQKQFIEMMPHVQQWGIQDAIFWENNPDVFETMDRNRQGWVIFEVVAEFILRRAILHLSAGGDEECRTEAIRLLKRTHPHMLDKAFPTKEQTWGGGVPPVPPPGQRRPPMPVDLDGPWQGGMSSPNRRFRTQYQSDYLCPQTLPAALAKSAASPAMSRMMSRNLTPRNVKPPSDMNTGIALIRSASDPGTTMRTQGLDKQALRTRLENQLDMYSTGQMRKLLKVAGGMVVGPPGR